MYVHVSAGNTENMPSVYVCIQPYTDMKSWVCLQESSLVFRGGINPNINRPFLYQQQTWVHSAAGMLCSARCYRPMCLVSWSTSRWRLAGFALTRGGSRIFQLGGAHLWATGLPSCCRHPHMPQACQARGPRGMLPQEILKSNCSLPHSVRSFANI